MWEMHIGFWVCTFICAWTLLLALDRKTWTLLKISVQLSSPKASNVLTATNRQCSTCWHEKEYPLKDIERLPPNRDYTSQFIFETFPSAHVRGTVWVHWMQLNPSFLLAEDDNLLLQAPRSLQDLYQQSSLWSVMAMHIPRVFVCLLWYSIILNDLNGFKHHHVYEEHKCPTTEQHLVWTDRKCYIRKRGIGAKHAHMVLISFVPNSLL